MEAAVRGSTMAATESPRRLRARTPADAVVATQVVAVCHAVEVGFAVAVQRTTDPRLAVAAKGAGEFVASIRCRVGDLPSKALLRDRLRLEWLASTMLPGRASERVLEECTRLLASCLQGLPLQHVFTDEAARLRVAHAEAYSLHRAIAAERRDELLFVPA